jgi:hypothetical protein
MTTGGSSGSSGGPSNGRVWAIAVGAFTIIGAVAALLALLPREPTTSITTGDQPGCIVTGSNNTCGIAERAEEVATNAPSPQQLKERVAAFSQSPPEAPGPWPYLVYNTFNEASGTDFGLSVKATPDGPGGQIGSTASGGIVYGECIATSMYDPEQGRADVDFGPHWLRIRWPSNTPETEFAASSPSDPFQGYVYLGYVLPFTHNGEIPACAGSS